MAKRPCRCCGKELFVGVSSLPEPTCHPCRRLNKPVKMSVPDQRRTRKRTCEVCGAAYGASYIEQRTCSRSCGVQLKGQLARWPVTRIAGYRDCIVCQHLFVARRVQSLTCGKECRTAHGRRLASQWATEHPERMTEATRRRSAMKRGTQTERMSYVRIAARDKWCCKLCGKPVDKALQWPHPLSKSFDHVVPLSRGGEHVAANVQLSHLRCNVVKGNRGGGEQLALIG